MSERGNAGVAQAREAAQDGLSDYVSSLQADIAGLKDTLARLVSQVSSQTATTVRQVGQSVASQVGSAASNAADAGSELATSAKEQAKTFAAELEGMAKRNPLGALAGALLVGVIIGMVSRGRS
jgi:ElaB/YqjD/DUF883 family membrane-anchored ribosome-binding protein